MTRTPQQTKLALRKMVRNFYDLQRLRMQMQLRLTKKAAGADIELFEADKIILENRMKELHTAEKHALSDMNTYLKQIPMYRDILSDKVRFKGIGPTMAGVILAEFDIHKEDTPSKMWAFAGLAPIPAKRCIRCNQIVSDTFIHSKNVKGVKCELAGREVHKNQWYISGQARKFKKGEKAPYNKFLKTKLVGVLGSVLLRLNSPWRKFYDDYKHRKESAGWGVSDGHRHNAAVRYMVKMLLLEIWKEWRTLEGLEVRPSYQEEYLGHKHVA